VNSSVGLRKSLFLKIINKKVLQVVFQRAHMSARPFVCSPARTFTSSTFTSPHFWGLVKKKEEEKTHRWRLLWSPLCLPPARRGEQEVRTRRSKTKADAEREQRTLRKGPEAGEAERAEGHSGDRLPTPTRSSLNGH